MNEQDTNANTLSSNLRQQRRQLGAKSPQAFAEVYLKNNCSAPYSKMHLEMFKKLLDITESRRAKVAIAAPRGHAKSTIVSLVYVLWCILYSKEKLIILASNTTEQANTLLKDIKHQLKNNPLLLSDFPEICRAKRPKPWRDNKIQLPNGAMICAYGASQSPRGIKNDKHRPGLIIADDLENEEQVESEEQREKLRSWFSGTLLNTGHPDTNVIVVGTILNHDSLLAKLVDSQRKPGWDGRVYKALLKDSDYPQLWEKWIAIFRSNEEYEGKTGPDAAKMFFDAYEEHMLEGTEVLWPEWESFYDLMVLRQTEGEIFFQREKQNCPLDPKQCIFKKENLTFWDEQYRDTQHLIESVGRYGIYYGACDPSLGRSARSDYTAIIVLLKDNRTNIMYVIAADLIQCAPDASIQRIIQYADIYHFSQFTVESNNFQQLLVDDLKRRLLQKGHKTRIRPVHHTSQKQARICALEPYVSQGLLRFNSNHQILLQQLTQFPMAKNDDGPDALEMVVDTARKPGTIVGALGCNDEDRFRTRKYYYDESGRMVYLD
ncbi:MAG: phage terminase large subunit [Planctomycetes bacterium]|nr:phage terminase large subunit [Planctomycetota bacterium]